MYYKEVSEIEFNKIVIIYSLLHKALIDRMHITTDEDKNGKYIEMRWGEEITPRMIVQIKDMKIKYYIRSEKE